MEAQFDLLNDTVKVGLVESHVPDIDTHTQWSDVSGDEMAGVGYTAGGETLAGKAVTQDDANDRGKFDATDVTWTSISAGTPSHAIMYDDTHANDLLIAYWEVTTVQNGGDYTLQWHGDGIILLT